MGASAPESNGRSRDTEALYREHKTSVAALCRSLLSDRGEAEDATQQVFLSAHRALLNGAEPREPLAWLLVVARHECYARSRQRPAAPVRGDNLPDAATQDASMHVMRAGELATVWDEVGRMPPAQREAFLLREIRGLSYGQLAAELSLSAPSVRSLLLRARTRLRHRLRDVAAGLAPWAQPLVRLIAGGDGASPLPAATRAAAIGVGTLALAGGGTLSRGVAHQPSRTPGPAAARHQGHAPVGHRAKPAGLVAAAAVARHTSAARRPVPEHSHQRSRASGSHEGSADLATSSDGGQTGSGRDGSDGTTVVTQPTTDGRDGSGGAPTTSGLDGSHDGSSGSSSSGPGPGPSSDGGSGTTTTVTTSGSDGSGSSGGHDSHGGG